MFGAGARDVVSAKRLLWFSPKVVSEAPLSGDFLCGRACYLQSSLPPPPPSAVRVSSRGRQTAPLEKEPNLMRMWGRTTREPRGLALVVVLLLMVLLSAVVTAPAAATAVRSPACRSGLRARHAEGDARRLQPAPDRHLRRGQGLREHADRHLRDPGDAGLGGLRRVAGQHRGFADRSVVLLDDNVNLFANGYDPQDFDDVYDLDKGQVSPSGRTGGSSGPAQPAASRTSRCSAATAS